MTPQELAQVGVAEKYLLCAKGLPQSDDNTVGYLNAIEKWAAELQQHPFTGDERQRTQALVGAVKMGQRQNRVPMSIQVVYVALGRLLGYPVRLASVASVPCVWWDDGKTKFEVRGLRWNELMADNLQNVEKEPLRIEFPGAPAESSSSANVRTLNPQDELSIFLGLRAVRLEEAGRIEEALVAFSQAHRLSPLCTDHLQGILRVAKKITPLVNYTQPFHYPDGRDTGRDDFEADMRMNALNQEIDKLRTIKSALEQELYQGRSRRP